MIIYYSLTVASNKVQHANGNGSSVMLPEVSGQSVFACFCLRALLICRSVRFFLSRNIASYLLVHLTIRFEMHESRGGQSVRPNRLVRFIGLFQSSVFRNLRLIGLLQNTGPRHFGLG